MSLENNNFISNNMNAILRRKRSIEIKRLNKAPPGTDMFSCGDVSVEYCTVIVDL